MYAGNRPLAALRTRGERWGGATPTPWSELNIGAAIREKDSRRGGFAIKKELTTLAKTGLPNLVDDRYIELVLACLSCLDRGEGNVFDVPNGGLNDRDGIIIGLRYIENVSSSLSRRGEFCLLVPRYS